jgi:O-antigen ligase
MLCVPAALRSSKALYHACRCLIWSGAGAAAFGIFDWIYLWQTGVLFDLPGSTQHPNVVHSTAGGFPRSPGTFTEPSVYAFFLILVMPVTLALALGACPQITSRRTAWLIFALEALALLLSFSVSGYVVLALVLALFVYLATSHFARAGNMTWLLRRALVGLMLVFATFTVLQFLGVYPADVGDFIVERLAGDADSAQIRFGLSRVAWDMARDHYLTGVGIGNYPFLAMNYAAIRDVTMVELILPTPSNLFLLFLAELGITGTIAFLWLLWGIARSLTSGIQRIAMPMRLLYLGLCAAMAGTLISFLFLDNLFVTYVWVVLGMTMALCHVASRETLQGSQGR